MDEVIIEVIDQEGTAYRWRVALDETATDALIEGIRALAGEPDTIKL